MDNKITKNRLSNFIAYEWLAIILAIVIVITGWEVVFALLEVKPTTGQTFKYFFDQGISVVNEKEVREFTVGSMSYDVLIFTSENVSEEHDLLSTRLKVNDGDVIFTNSKPVNSQDLSVENNVRAKRIVDSFGAYRLDRLLEDGQKYLKNTFFKEEYKTQTLGSQDYTIDKIDLQKVEDVFLQRMQGDNRFRTDEQKQQGIQKERARVEQLCVEVCDFAYFLEYAESHPELLYRYTMYEQALEISLKTGEDLEDVQELYNNNVSFPGQVNAIYGINLNGLKGGEGKSNPSEFFKLKDSESAENVVMMAFEMTRYQPHLQFETISFMNTIIRKCSTILDR